MFTARINEDKNESEVYNVWELSDEMIKKIEDSLGYKLDPEKPHLLVKRKLDDGNSKYVLYLNIFICGIDQFTEPSNEKYILSSFNEEKNVNEVSIEFKAFPS